MVPEPLHGCTIGDIRRASRPRTASKQGDDVIVRTNNSSARVPTAREQTRIAIVRVHRHRDRVKVTKEAITSCLGLKAIETTDSGTRCAATFEDELRGVAVDVLSVRLLDLGGGENGFELVDAILRVVERGGYVAPRVKKTREFACLDLRA